MSDYEFGTFGVDRTRKPWQFWNPIASAGGQQIDCVVTPETKEVGFDLYRDGVKLGTYETLRAACEEWNRGASINNQIKPEDF